MSMNLDNKTVSIKQILIGGVVLFVLYWLIVHLRPSKTPSLPVPTVVVSMPQSKTMAEYVTQTGTTVAFNSVDLVARIEGYLTQIEFTDGSIVKKNQELLVVEPEPYLEKLKAAQANVAAQKALAQYDQAEYERQKRMYKENATSLNNVEKWLAKSHQSKAEVDKSIADEQIAAINYSYTHILAPFDGRIGRHLVDVGNLVGNGAATDLANIEQIDPIYVYFNLNELDLIRMRAAAAKAGMDPKEIRQVMVHVAMQNEEGFPHEGTLDFVNTGLNASTGTMEFRALLPNKKFTLLPGMFVQVRVAITKPTSQLVVTDSTVQYDQIGPYLLLVDKENKVLLKRVQIGGLEEGMRAITKGITAQDRVIVDGLQNAIPGNAVQVQLQKESTPPIENTK